MAQEISIEIYSVGSPSPTKAAQFVPQTKTVMVNDLVFWRNNDPNSAHQPMPQGGAADAWVTEEIPAMLVDDPLGGGTATSNTVSFSAGSTKQGLTYTCALHSGEVGTLIVLNNINIKNNPGAAAGAPVALYPSDPHNPPTFEVNEAFVFSNTDTHAHWPAPSLQQQNAWMSQAIQPGQTSPPISINQPTGPNPLTYICVLHSSGTQKETGVLAVQQSE